MNATTEQNITEIAIQTLAELGFSHYFLVELKMSASKQFFVLYDADGSGVKINELAKLNRVIREKIDATNLFPNGDYSLEVSSYGIDKPLLQYRQYVKNVGRNVEVKLKTNEMKEGLLESVTPNSITLKEQISKKEMKTSTYLFDDIQQTHLIIKI